jgi:hypothetical protein
VFGRQHIIILIERNEQGNPDFGISPVRSIEPPGFDAFYMGEISAYELIKRYYMDLGLTDDDADLFLREKTASKHSVWYNDVGSVRLYFYSLGFNERELHDLVNRFRFTPDKIRAIIGGVWPWPRNLLPDTPLVYGPLNLRFEVTLALVENTIQIAECNLIPESIDADCTVISLSAQWGALPTVPTRLPYLRQVITAYLYWKPSVPSIGEQVRLRPEIQQSIREICAKNRELRSKILAILYNLPPAPAQEGDSWFFWDEDF